MSVQGGRFSGSKPVSRRELAITLAKLAKSLEKGDWAGKSQSPIKSNGGTGDETVSRYVLASAIDKVARAIATAMPKPSPKDIHNSIALPKPMAAPVPKGDPAYDALEYLGKHRMISAQSVLLKPGQEPV